MKITRQMGRACRAAMREIADGASTTRTVERGYDTGGTTASDALHELGWMSGRRDFFRYERHLRAGWPEYHKEQVLMALAMCITLSDVHAQGTFQSHQDDN